ncbi:MAG: hypothetical protein K2W81_02270 [Sphingomonas sp.]|uniref:hypothetical protein n=1 Tax=Sphingomonas sp. TaxID=28214 RepID=UPI0025CB905C|nr:hypothetical protein [Sphingomonas sp.]MBY0282774.1 hypothetical protein [Sphingomonas sp.]
MIIHGCSSGPPDTASNLSKPPKAVVLASTFDSRSLRLPPRSKVTASKGLIAYSPDGPLTLQSQDCVGSPFWIEVNEEVLAGMERMRVGKTLYGMKFFRGDIVGVTEDDSDAPARVIIRATVANLRPTKPPPCADPGTNVS